MDYYTINSTDPAEDRAECPSCPGNGEVPECACGGRGWLSPDDLERVEREAAENAAAVQRERDDARYGDLYLLLDLAHRANKYGAQVHVYPAIRVFTEPGAEPMIDAEVSFSVSDPASKSAMGIALDPCALSTHEAFDGARVIVQQDGRHTLVLDVEVEDLRRLYTHHPELLPEVRVSLHADYTTTPEDYNRAWKLYQDFEIQFTARETP